MKKFIRGTFELDQNVTDLVAYENARKAAIEELVAWADCFSVGLNMGTAEDNSYLCEYRITGKTVSYCKGLLSELRTMLKETWKRPKTIIQIQGDIL